MSNKSINSFLIEKGYIKNDEQITVLKMVELVDEWQEQLNKEQKLHSVSKSVAKQYAEFCVRCDREGLQLLELDDYIKQYCC